MADKDFFDAEFEKTVQEKDGQSQDNEQMQKADLDSWYNRPAPAKAEKKLSKPLHIVLTCFVLIACIAFGWLLCYLVDDLTTPEEEKILRTVMEYLKNNYYEDVDNWTEAIEYSGTAMMQKAGDKFSQLMSPETYYSFMYAESVSSTSTFGVSFYLDDMGLTVASVVANSNAYGRLQEGDFVLKLSNVKALDCKSALVVDGETIDEIVFSQWSSATIKIILGQIGSATFHFLRTNAETSSGYELMQENLQRDAVYGVDNEYAFIEYYFDSEHKNISTENLGSAKTNTFEERKLSQLPDKTGYIRITQFMDYAMTDSAGRYLKDKDGKILKRTASDEFKEVMKVFKSLGYERLVLDLKGNPGGNVQYVSEIAGLLVTSAKLSPEQKKIVTNSKGELLMSYLEMPKPAHVRDNYYSASTYNQYFGAIGETLDIVVWTDGGSASGSEMLTGALLDYGTAVHMGTRTYGKGIAQAVVELPFTQILEIKGEKVEVPWAIYYTCAKYYPPLSDNIHEVGYTPEVYNGLSTYESLWQAAKNYWAIS